jgi:hypothetical protein
LSAQLVPLTTAPNQQLVVSLNVNGVAIDLYISLHYNEIAGWWVMTIANAAGQILLSSVPFITGSEPAGNLLGQFQYMGFGGATVINASQAANDFPSNTQLGADFFLVWYDNSPVPVQ